MTSKGLRCPICGATSEGGHAIGDSTVIICPHCGGYRLAGTAIALLEKGTLRRPDAETFLELVKRKRGTSPEYPVITSDDLASVDDHVRFEKLVEFVREDPRLHDIDVVIQPGVLRLQIGGQQPWWCYDVPPERLRQGNLPALALSIVDKWAEWRARRAK
jgi:hypothetical protein